MNQNVQQLAIFKIEKVNKEEQIIFCGFALNEDEVKVYMEKVQKMIDVDLQNGYEGEYLVLPALYWKLQRGLSVKRQTKNK